MPISLHGSAPNAAILLLFITILLGCSGESTEKGTPTKASRPAEAVSNLPEAPAPPASYEPEAWMQDSVQQIRTWFYAMTGEMDAYEKTDHSIDYKGLKINISEFAHPHEDSTAKILYKSNHMAVRHPLLQPEQRLADIVREYYYRRGTLFFVFEKLNMLQAGGDTTAIENRYYLGPEKMVMWLRGKGPVSPADSLYKKMADLLVHHKGRDLLAPYLLAANSNSPELMAQDDETAIEMAQEYLLWKYPYINSLSPFGDDLVEASYPEKEGHYRTLFLLKSHYDRTYRYFVPVPAGKLYTNPALISSPADFQYYLVHLAENNDTTALRRHIRPEGYSVTFESHGPEEGDDYHETYMVSRDTARFGGYEFTFSKHMYSFLNEPDTAFTNGRGYLNYGGGGAYAQLLLEKRGDSIYMVSFSEASH